jgi:hypothetical protein
MQNHPLGAERTGRHDEADSHFSQSCERAKITTGNDVKRLDAAKDDLGLKTLRCVQHPLWRVWSGLRWTDRTSVETLARQLSHEARTIPQVSGSLCKHVPLHQNTGRQNPFHQTPVCEPPYFFRTARSFCLDCWTLKISYLPKRRELFAQPYSIMLRKL